MSSASEPPESPTEPMAGAQLHGRLVWGMAMLFVIIMATVTLAIISAGEGTGGAPDGVAQPLKPVPAFGG